MDIVNSFPPNIEEIRKVFDLTGKKPVFSYGKILYVPYGGHIDEPLMKHEMTHAKYQLEMGVEEWWNAYLNNRQFRLDQEIEAYQVQYREYCKLVKDRERRFRFLNHVASDLASPMYGNIVTREEAIKLIKQ